jgi:hypothetical protein
VDDLARVEPHADHIKAHAQRRALQASAPEPAPRGPDDVGLLGAVDGLLRGVPVAALGGAHLDDHELGAASHDEV